MCRRQQPNQPPAIRFNFMSAQLDREVTLEAMRITRRIMTAPAMQGIVTDEIAPGVNIQADDELLDWVKRNAETTYHPVGTCKMGSDPMAVVDNELRVHGMQGLRVADASIMPTLTSGQHQCAVDHDRREGVADDPGGGSLRLGGRPAPAVRRLRGNPGSPDRMIARALERFAVRGIAGPTCHCEARSAEAISCLTSRVTLVRQGIASALRASQ